MNEKDDKGMCWSLNALPEEVDRAVKRFHRAFQKDFKRRIEEIDGQSN